MSDTVILSTIIVFFVALGAVIPFVHSSFNQAGDTFNTEGIEFASGQSTSTNSVTVLGVVVSITTMFFWTFGNIPAILDIIIFVPIRIIFLVLLFKLVRGVGG